MGKINRIRFSVTPSTISLMVATSGAVSSDAPSAAASSDAASAAGSLSTAFSCGSRWTDARTCSTLCPSGDDEACPPGQYCYGGIPCSIGDDGEESKGAGVVGQSMEVLERQRRLERQEMDRLARQKEEKYVGRFVCGGSYDEAAEICASSPPFDQTATAVGPLGETVTAFYCPTGSSLKCPAGMRCYAAVPCPRSTHYEEPSLIREVSLQLLSPFITEPILLNATNVGGRNSSLAHEEWYGLSHWSSLLRESSSAVLGRALVLLSSHHGLN
mmetsp:Transcript_47872/g.101714  ORF Transcript_47872/g.101714 Transcript_47872/m.101714 type:complete len:272 (-) Transcript_47872:349-1164(-)